jgi:hypothetical protein
MKLSYTAIWQDVIALCRAHGALIAAVAGVFIFLPGLLSGYLIPQPEPTNLGQLRMLMVEYLEANWHWILLQGLLAMIGAIAILLLIFSSAGTSVGGALAASLPLLVSYFLGNLIAGLITCLGLLLLIVPGLYLFGRLAPLGAVIVAENRRNPIDAIARTFQLTKGKGWAILGLLIVIGIAAVIVMSVVNTLLGLIFVLAAGQELGRLLTLIVMSATSTAFSVLFILLYAALYRRLSPRESAAFD